MLCAWVWTSSSVLCLPRTFHFPIPPHRLHTGKSKGLDLLNEPHPASYPEFYPVYLSVESMIAIINALDRLMTAARPSESLDSTPPVMDFEGRFGLTSVRPTFPLPSSHHDPADET